MDGLQTLLEDIDNIAVFAGILDEASKAARRAKRQAKAGKAAKAKAKEERAAAKEAAKDARAAEFGTKRLSKEERKEKNALRRAASTAKKAAKKLARQQQADAPKLSQQERKHARSYEKTAEKKRPRAPMSKGQRASRFGHKFANETTFKKERGGSHDPGGAMVSTPGLRKKLSKDPKRFLKFPAGSKRGRYPIRGGNRASLAGTLRQASKRDPFIYRKAVERIKSSASNKMHRKKDPTVTQPHVERPRPLGGKPPVRPHGHGGLPPSPGPSLKADKKKAKGREEKHETRRRHGRNRVRAVTGDTAEG